MVMTSTQRRQPKDQRLNAALRLVLRRYFAQVRRWKVYAVPALLLHVNQLLRDYVRREQGKTNR